jgi:hypothetical protein
MGMEGKPRLPIPQENQLPLKINAGERIAESGESDVWKVAAQDPEEQEKMIALKQIRREQFANDEEMRASKQFYDYLKNFPEFGAFVPDTLYFKARMKAGDAPQAFALQEFIEGKTVDELSDEELYKDPEVVKQLLDFAHAAIKILAETRAQKIAKPDFGTAGTANPQAQKFGNTFGNSRYSTNILISDKPHQNGKRIFFVDTGVNADERVNRTRQIVERQVMGRVRQFNFNQWAAQLEKLLASSAEKPVVAPAE